MINIFQLQNLVSILFGSKESPGYRKESVSKAKINYPKEIVLIGGGTGWHFTDRPFATHFGYTPIYKSISTYRMEGKPFNLNKSIS